jgi:hypothetical protein
VSQDRYEYEVLREQEEAEYLSGLEKKYPNIAAMWPRKEIIMDKIAPAFIKAKRAFAPALKDKSNPQFRSKYADLGACIDAVEDALLANGIAFMQETFEDPAGVTVETVFLHESGESMRCGKLHVPAAKQDPQGYGSALTYARRYSLMAACGIAPEDDDGNAASKKPTAAVQAPGPQIAASFRSSATMGAMDLMTDEQKTYLQLVGSIVVNKVASGDIAGAFEKIKGEKFDSDETTALWSLLDSKTRSALTKHGNALKALTTTKETATQ